MKRILPLILCAVLLVACSKGTNSAYVPTGDALDSDTPTTATSAQETEEDLFSMSFYAEETLNPYACTNITNQALFSLLYQGLFSVSRDYVVEPVLCDHYTRSANMRSYTFYIVANATFSDGTRLQIEDVFSSMLTAQTSDRYKGRFDHVTEISLSEDGGVTFTLDCAYENFPILLDIPIVKASEVTIDRPLGTGPYELVSTTLGDSLCRLDAWWCSYSLPLNCSVIPLQHAESAAKIRDAFEFEDVGLVYTDPGAGSAADYRCDYEVWDSEAGLFLYLGANTAKGKIFANDSVRAALTYAIDRSLIAETYYGGFATPATLPASPSSPYYDTALASRYTYDPERFENAIVDAGYSDQAIVLLVNSGDSVRVQVAKAIAQMLEDCGVTVTLMERSGTEYTRALSGDDYDLYLGQTRLSATMDLTAFFRSYGGLSYGDMDNATIYAMCLEALENSGNYYNLHKLVMQDGQLCPILFHSYAVYATRGLLPDLSPARDNVFYYSTGRTLESAFTPSE